MKATRLLFGFVAGGVALFGSACSDSPVDAGSEFTAELIGSTVESLGLLYCSPLPADSVTVTMGPEGGQIEVGPHTLSVPEGALDSTVAITAVAPSDTVNHVEFSPDGLTFQRSAALTMSYANCDAASSTLPKRIAYVSDALAILEYLIGADDPVLQTVTGRLDHFSGYAVAW